MKIKKLRLHSMTILIVGFLSMSIITTTYASGVAPYLPIHSSPALDNEIERLATIANIPNLTKPYNLATINFYLETINESHPTLYRRLSQALAPYNKSFSTTQLQLTLSQSNNKSDATASEGEVVLKGHKKANNNGIDSHQNFHLKVRSQWQITNWLGVYMGTQIAEKKQYLDNPLPFDDDDSTQFDSQFDGSLISIGTSQAQLDIGYKEHWFGPFNGSAQLISNHSQTMPSISLSNNLPLNLYGHKINYELFLAKMSTQPVLYNEEFSSTNNPYLAGMHISFQPTSWWTLGANRTFQFSGGERPFSLKKVLSAFFDPRGTDNRADTNNQSGNQIASITSKINIDSHIPFSLSVEYAGEDTGNSIEGQLGNSALITGLYIPYLFNDSLSLNYEYSNWQTAWYANSLYQWGYVHEGYVVGHWGAQPQRDERTAKEGHSHYINTVWQTPNSHIISLAIRRASNTPSSTYKDSWEAQMTYSWPLRQHILSFVLNSGEDYQGQFFSQVGVKFSW